MPQVLSEKKGGHDYDELTSGCKFDCGCWVVDDRSGGLNWVDPFGKCPKNPKNKIRMVRLLDF